MAPKIVDPKKPIPQNGLQAFLDGLVLRNLEFDKANQGQEQPRDAEKRQPVVDCQCSHLIFVTK